MDADAALRELYGYAKSHPTMREAVESVAAALDLARRGMGAWSDEAYENVRVRNSLADALSSQTGIPSGVLIEAHKSKRGGGDK